MIITTLIMFLTILLFCLVIIFFLKDTLKDGELDEAEKAQKDIANLLESKPIDTISPLDISASLENFQEVLIYDHNGKNYYFKLRTIMLHTFILVSIRIIMTA